LAQIKKDINKENNFKPLQLGNIYAKRDWSHAKDFVKGIWLMLNQQEPKEYILASGQTYTVKEFINKALNFFGFNGQWINDGLEEKYIYQNQTIIEINPNFYRPAEVDLLLGNPENAKKMLNWSPDISFNELVKEMAQNDMLNM